MYINSASMPSVSSWSPRGFHLRSLKEQRDMLWLFVESAFELNQKSITSLDTSLRFLYNRDIAEGHKKQKEAPPRRHQLLLGTAKQALLFAHKPLQNY